MKFAFEKIKHSLTICDFIGNEISDINFFFNFVYLKGQMILKSLCQKKIFL